ncbi:hypothetical protein F183_A29590 [Bryobacterales bacterium F-183]|nr:hypothetical protein F183_A29590 [Bryobacterales bacterium F-183]
MSSSYPSKELAESLSEQALLLRLKSTEHDFVERKPKSQKGEWLQVAVAFANSAPIGWPCILFAGASDDGVPQEKPEHLETLVRTVTGVLDQAYPAIYRHVVPLTTPEGCCVAVIIPGSPERPHFAGKAYVRREDGIREASADDYQALLAERSGLVRELRQHLGESVRLDIGPRMGPRHKRMRLVDCNQWYVTLENLDVDAPKIRCLPISRIELNYDPWEKKIVLIAETWA